MRRWLLLALLATPLFGDLRIVTELTVGSAKTRRTESYGGGNVRYDSGQISAIRTGNQLIVLEHSRREYYVRPAFQAFLFANPGRPTTVQVDTRATGEQKTAWGYVARRYVTTEREDDGSSPEKVSTSESWYLQIPAPVTYRPMGIPVLSLQSSNQPPPIIRRVNSGVTPTGILIDLTSERGRLEVVELSQSPLPDSLFVPPSDYRRVIRPIPGQDLSWNDRILYCWQQVENWFDQLFN